MHVLWQTASLSEGLAQRPVPKPRDDTTIFRMLNDMVWTDESASWVVPSNKRFAANNLTSLGSNLRLEVEFEF